MQILSITHCAHFLPITINYDMLSRFAFVLFICSMNSFVGHSKTMEEHDEEFSSSTESSQIPFLAPIGRNVYHSPAAPSDASEVDALRKRGRSPAEVSGCEEDKTIWKAQLDHLLSADPLASPPPICEYLLRHYFHIPSGTFRPRQFEVCASLLRGKSTLAICPTGWGKSLCYLFPMLVHRLIFTEELEQQKSRSHQNKEEALPCSKFCVVVSPLISLMADQALKILSVSSVKSIVLSSQMGKDREERVLDNLASPQSSIDIVFTSPEKLIGCSQLRNILSEQPHRLAFLCVDEVHCVSKWAFNFRPSYLCIHRLMDWSAGSRKPSNTQFLCLTATATGQVINDLKGMFSISHTVECSDQFRNNLDLGSVKLGDSAGPPTTKMLHDNIISCIHELPKPLIVYVRSRIDADEIASLLSAKMKGEERGSSDTGEGAFVRRKYKTHEGKEAGQLVVRGYHAALSRELRNKIQRQFISDEIDVLVATVAFGMGIDKSNIRSVIHAHAPTSLENYVQEIGRAGRDGQLSFCRILFNPYDFYFLRSSMFTSYVSSREVASIIYEMLRCSCTEIGETVLIIPTEKIALTLETHVEIVETLLYSMVLKFDTYFKGIRGMSPVGYKIVTMADNAAILNTSHSKKNKKSLKMSVANVLHQVAAHDPVLDLCRKSNRIENIVDAANQLHMSLSDFQFRLNDLFACGAVTAKRLATAYLVEVQPKFNELLAPLAEHELADALFKDHEAQLLNQVNALSSTFAVLENPSHSLINSVMRGERTVSWKPPPRSLTKLEGVGIVNEFVESNRMRLQSKYEAVRALMGIMPKSAIKTGKFAGQVPLAQSWYTKSPYFGTLREFDFQWVMAVAQKFIFLRMEMKQILNRSRVVFAAMQCQSTSSNDGGTGTLSETAAAVEIPVYLKPTSHPRRKPSFYIPRMRDSTAPNDLIRADGLGTANPLFTIASSSCEYYALRLPLLNAGFKRVAAPATPGLCNLIWGRSMPFRSATEATSNGSRRVVLAFPPPNSEERAAKLQSLTMTSDVQHFNHFPFSHRNIGCKKGLARNIRRMTSYPKRDVRAAELESKYAFVPKTWCLPQEQHQLLQHFRDCSAGDRFIWKPARGSCGRGIFFSKGGSANSRSWEMVLEEIHRAGAIEGKHLYKDYVVQEYVENPLLLEDRKMDLRLYVGVTSFDPLVVYLHEDGLVRLAAERYTTNDSSGPDEPSSVFFKHLTNFSIGRKHMNFSTPKNSFNTTSTAENLQLKWSLDRLWKHLDKNYSNSLSLRLPSQQVKEDIALVVVRTLMAIQPSLRVARDRVKMPGQYLELFGFDIMLKEDLSPVLIEVNTLPSLESSSPFDYATKSNVVSDLLNLSMMEPFERNQSAMSEISSNTKLTVPPCTGMIPYLHTLEAQQSGSFLSVSHSKNDVLFRLKDERSCARGFKRIFPPIKEEAGSAFSAPEGYQKIMQDIQLYETLGCLSEKDRWALSSDY